MIKNRIKTIVVCCILFSPITAFAGEIVNLGIKVFPVSAAVLIDGEKQVFTSREENIAYYPLKEGLYTMQFRCPGYISQSLQLAVGNDTGILEVKLERADSCLELVSRLSTGVQPKSAVFDDKRNRIYVPLLWDSGIEVFQIEPFRYLKRIQPAAPYSAAVGFVEPLILEKREELWISQMTRSAVHIFDLNTLEYLDTIDLEGNWSKVIETDEDETRAYISNWLSEDISVVDVETREQIGSIPVEGTPRGLALDNKRHLLYIANYKTGYINIADTRTMKVIDGLNLAPGAKRHLVLDEERDILYASDMLTGNITVIDVENLTVIREVYVAPKLNTIALDKTGHYLFISSRGPNNPVDYQQKGPEFGKILIMDTQDYSIVDWQWGRNQPTALAVNGKYMVYSNFLDYTLEMYRIDRLYDSTFSQ